MFSFLEVKEYLILIIPIRFIQEMEKQPPRRSSSRPQPVSRNASAASRNAGAARTGGKRSPANKNSKTGSAKTAPKTKSLWVIFWLAFSIVVFCLFMVNLNRIRSTLESAYIIRPPQAQSTTAHAPHEMAETAVVETQTDEIIIIEAPPAEPPAELPAPVVSGADDAVESPVAVQPVSQPPAIVIGSPPAAAVPAFRERSVFFINVDRDGVIVRTRVARNLPVSETPLMDVLNALLEGPLPEEHRIGLMSLIPDGSRVINTIVRGNTAYINLSEEFQFNIHGVEGCAASLMQIVWTATEFANVRDVQILIEGRRLDFLGEGVYIGVPISRDML